MQVSPLAERLAPDSIARLQAAASQRFATAELLRGQNRLLAALYFYGHCTEMWLSSAYFRGAGFGVYETIDRDTRQRRMAQARQLKLPNGEALMNSDPHPLVGWAQLLKWQRSASELTAVEIDRFNEAVNKAIVIYNYWRPELRYKTLEITNQQLGTVRSAVMWFKDNHQKLSEV